MLGSLPQPQAAGCSLSSRHHTLGFWFVFLFLREKTIIHLLCFNLITMSNSFLALCSGLEKDSIISTVARRLLPGHKILIRNNHAALKWELRAAKKVKPSIKYSMAEMYY